MMKKMNENEECLNVGVWMNEQRHEKEDERMEKDEEIEDVYMCVYLCLIVMTVEIER